MRNGASTIVVFLIVSAVAAASGSNYGWQDKEFKNWTNEDAQAVMRDSPWAKRLSAPAGGRPAVTVIEPGANGAPPPSASLGNPQNAATGANVTGASLGNSSGNANPADSQTFSNSPTPSGVPHSAGAPEIQQPITIIWASAAPVRLAILKLRAGTKAPSEAQISRAREAHHYYTIAVSGLPAPETGSDPGALAKNSFLSTRAKASVSANSSSYRRIGDSDVYFFRFERSALPLALSDKEVEFKMILGSMEVKRKFSLKDMQYGGELAL